MCPYFPSYLYYLLGFHILSFWPNLIRIPWSKAVVKDVGCRLEGCSSHISFIFFQKGKNLNKKWWWEARLQFSLVYLVLHIQNFFMNRNEKLRLKLNFLFFFQVPHTNGLASSRGLRSYQAIGLYVRWGWL